MWLRANLNFGNYRRNNVYLLPDANYSQEQALTLVGAGYFVEVDDDRDDNADDDTVFGRSLVVSKPKSGVADGQGADQPGAEAAHRKSADNSPGGKDD